MRNITFYLILCLIICSCNIANNSQITDQDSNSQNPTESFWNCWGIYQGTIPAADCPGIDVTLEINKDNTFQSKFVYQERNITFEDQGLYTINDSILTTIGENADTVYYKITDNSLKMLDQYKNEIPDEIGKLYILKKQEHL